MENQREDNSGRLEELRAHIGDCRRCKLHATRNTIVFGEGSPEARVMFIGEGPGREEDLQGRPFVGRAGQLLTAIIEKGMMMKRSDVYIANVVKCRPTVDMKFERDRPPDDEERSACGQFLLKQIEIIRPAVIITLGNPSTHFLLNIKQGITKARGNWFMYGDIPVMPTYHPSYILRNGGDASLLKRDVWDDIKKVLDRLANPGSAFEKPVKESQGPLFEGLRDTVKKDDDKQGSLF